MNMHLHRALSLFVVLTIGMSCAAVAQPYPARPVRVIVGFPPGGGVDVLARIMAPKLGERWEQQVVVDNRPGAGGRISAEVAAKAAPDGYTVLMITMSHAVGAGLYRKLAYHPADSFSAVSLLASTALVLLAHPSLPVKSLKDVIALAKARPGELSFGSSGIGGSPHLAGELFKGMAGINIVHVPYKGAGIAYTDLIGGHVELVIAALPGALPHIKSSKARAIALTSAKRSPASPEIPTIAESGVAGYDVTHWFGLLAPAGTDRKIVDQLHDAFVAVLRIHGTTEAVAKAGMDPVGSTPREFDAFLRSEIARWAKVIRDAGVKVE